MGQVLHGSARTTERLCLRSSGERPPWRESGGQALRRQPDDDPEVAGSRDDDRCRHGSEGAALDDADAGGRGDRRRFSASYPAAAGRLPLRLQPTIPHLTRSSLHRCLQRHGISRLPEIEGDKPEKKRFKQYPIGYFHIDIAQVSTEEGQAVPLRGDRSHQQVRLRPSGRERRQDGSGAVPARADSGGSLPHPHRPDG